MGFHHLSALTGDKAKILVLSNHLNLPTHLARCSEILARLLDKMTPSQDQEASISQLPLPLLVFKKFPYSEHKQTSSLCDHDRTRSLWPTGRAPGFHECILQRLDSNLRRRPQQSRQNYLTSPTSDYMSADIIKFQRPRPQSQSPQNWLVTDPQRSTAGISSRIDEVCFH